MGMDFDAIINRHIAWRQIEVADQAVVLREVDQITTWLASANSSNGDAADRLLRRALLKLAGISPSACGKNSSRPSTSFGSWRRADVIGEGGIG